MRRKEIKIDIYDVISLSNVPITSKKKKKAWEKSEEGKFKTEGLLLFVILRTIQSLDLSLKNIVKEVFIYSLCVYSHNLKQK